MTQEAQNKKSPSSKRRGRPSKKVALTRDTITSDQVRNAFEQTGSLPPSDDELCRLARIFTRYKAYFWGAREDAEYTLAAREALDSIEILQGSLRKLWKYQNAKVNAGEIFFAYRMREDIAKLVVTIDEVKPIIKWNPVKPGHEIKDWRWLIDVIFDVVKPSFPKGGLSKEGPIARFLSKIILIMSGDDLTPKAVASQIINRRAELNKDRK